MNIEEILGMMSDMQEAVHPDDELTALIDSVSEAALSDEMDLDELDLVAAARKEELPPDRRGRK